ncbi:hypothetical protein R2F25_38260 [Streptomyces sp. UP1A-1]|nr:hypothetical protein [Streptomyces sp. UP1A-1]
MSTMLEAWDAEAVRRRFATPAVLRTMQGGRARRFYGRPRKPAPAGSKLTKQGYTPVVCTFACVDSKAYDDVEQIARANLVPPDHYGLVGPLTTPLTMTAESASKNAGEVVVGGTKPTWPVITIYGPISNPVCEVVGRWKAGLDLTLGVGERVVIDPRPWVRTVMRNGNASVAGKLTRGTPQLKDMRLPRGRAGLRAARHRCHRQRVHDGGLARRLRLPVAPGQDRSCTIVQATGSVRDTSPAAPRHSPPIRSSDQRR